MQIGGYVIPKGTALIVPPCAIHTSTAAWGPDAGKWRPRRWLQGNSMASMKLTPAGHSRFLPFFDGPSKCIGQHLALVHPPIMTCILPYICRL